MGLTDDKALRIRTGTELLRRIKENGGTAADVAKFLGVSATTLSHWNSGDPNRLKRVGAPTNAQLQKLVGYLCARIKENQQNLLNMVVGGVVRHREQMMMLKSLAPAFSSTNENWTNAMDTKTEKVEDFVRRLQEYHEKNSDEARPGDYWDELLRYCSHMQTLPTQENLAEGTMAWDYDNLRRHMLGFDDGVRAIENIVEEMIEKEDRN